MHLLLFIPKNPLLAGALEDQTMVLPYACPYHTLSPSWPAIMKDLESGPVVNFHEILCVVFAFLEHGVA